ncbi:hypothetical protein V6N13_108563 [Hibiscus sabdariffa]
MNYFKKENGMGTFSDLLSHCALSVMLLMFCINIQERQLEEEIQQLKSQLELEKCFQPAQGLGDPNIEPSIQMG